MESLEKNFEILDSLPVVVCLLNLPSEEVMYANKSAKVTLGDNVVGKLFYDIFENGDDLKASMKKTLNKDEIIKVFGQLKDGKRFMLHLKEHKPEENCKSALMVTGVDITSIKRETYFNTSKQKNDMLNIYNKSIGLDFLEACLHDIESDNNYFSVAYVSVSDIEGLIKEGSISEKKEHVKELVAVIKNSIRSTDMFCSMEDEGTEFLMVFPKCKYEIMSNILTAIENKLEFINDTNKRRFNFKINYAILEVSKKNIACSEEIVKQIKNMLV